MYLIELYLIMNFFNKFGESFNFFNTLNKYDKKEMKIFSSDSIYKPHINDDRGSKVK